MADQAKYPINASDAQIGAIGDNIHIEGGVNFNNVYQMARPAPVDADTLVRAEQQLSEMPTGRVPAVATLP